MEATRQCPFCGKSITLAEYAALRDRIRKGEDPAVLQEFEAVRQDITKSVRESLESEYVPLRRQLDTYVKKEKSLNERSTELELRAKAIDAEVAKRVREGQSVLTAEVERRVREELQLAAQEKDAEIARLTERISQLGQDVEVRVTSEIQDRERLLRGEMQKDFDARQAGTLAKLKEYQSKELQFEKACQDLAVKKQGIELEVQKRLSNERDTLFKDASRQARETYEIEAKDNERRMQLLKQQVAQLREQLLSGSPQERGYIQQEDLANFLKQLYPSDEILEIKRGVHGADILHQVKLRSGAIAGTILWESKRTKDFHEPWIDKLREDQREQRADAVILVSQVLPEGVNHFAVRNGVVITDPSIVDAVSNIVRQQLINLTRHKMTEEQRQDKMHDLYAFMTGKEFHQRISGIVESAVNLEELTDREIRAHEKLWSQRKKMHERLVRQTAILYGEVSGIVGTLPSVPQLQLPEDTDVQQVTAGKVEEEEVEF
jgi:hypothetical protein